MDRAEIENMLTDGTLRTSRPIPRDRVKYRSDVYQIFELLYDQDDKVILHWFRCSRCELIMNIVLRDAGNSQMKRHRCFREYLEEQNNDESDDGDDSENASVVDPDGNGNTANSFIGENEVDSDENGRIADLNSSESDAGPDGNDGRSEEDVLGTNESNNAHSFTIISKHALAHLFAQVSQIGFERGPMEPDKIFAIMPKELNAKQDMW